MYIHYINVMELERSKSYNAEWDSIAVTNTKFDRFVVIDS